MNHKLQFLLILVVFSSTVSAWRMMVPITESELNKQPRFTVATESYCNISLDLKFDALFQSSNTVKSTTGFDPLIICNFMDKLNDWATELCGLCLDKNKKQNNNNNNNNNNDAAKGGQDDPADLYESDLEDEDEEDKDLAPLNNGNGPVMPRASPLPCKFTKVCTILKNVNTAVRILFSPKIETNLHAGVTKAVEDGVDLVQKIIDAFASKDACALLTVLEAVSDYVDQITSIDSFVKGYNGNAGLCETVFLGFNAFQDRLKCLKNLPLPNDRNGIPNLLLESSKCFIDVSAEQNILNYIETIPKALDNAVKQGIEEVEDFVSANVLQPAQNEFLQAFKDAIPTSKAGASQNSTMVCITVRRTIKHIDVAATAKNAFMAAVNAYETTKDFFTLGKIVGTVPHNQQIFTTTTTTVNVPCCYNPKLTTECGFTPCASGCFNDDFTKCLDASKCVKSDGNGGNNKTGAAPGANASKPEVALYVVAFIVLIAVSMNPSMSNTKNSSFKMATVIVVLLAVGLYSTRGADAAPLDMVNTARAAGSSDPLCNSEGSNVHFNNTKIGAADLKASSKILKATMCNFVKPLNDFVRTKCQQNCTTNACPWSNLCPLLNVLPNIGGIQIIFNPKLDVKVFNGKTIPKIGGQDMIAMTESAATNGNTCSLINHLDANYVQVRVSIELDGFLKGYSASTDDCNNIMLFFNDFEDKLSCLTTTTIPSNRKQVPKLMKDLSTCVETIRNLKYIDKYIPTIPAALSASQKQNMDEVANFVANEQQLNPDSNEFLKSFNDVFPSDKSSAQKNSSHLCIKADRKIHLVDVAGAVKTQFLASVSDLESEQSTYNAGKLFKFVTGSATQIFTTSVTDIKVDCCVNLGQGGCGFPACSRTNGAGVFCYSQDLTRCLSLTDCLKEYPVPTPTAIPTAIPTAVPDADVCAKLKSQKDCLGKKDKCGWCTNTTTCLATGEKSKCPSGFTSDGAINKMMTWTTMLLIMVITLALTEVQVDNEKEERNIESSIAQESEMKMMKKGIERNGE